MNKIIATLLLALLPALVSAQTLRADRVTLNAGPCTIRSGVGSPEGYMTGNVCDTYYRTTSPYDTWRKVTGSGTNTGWVVVTNALLASLTGSGTAGKIPKWTSATVFGDSLLSESGSTVTTTGAHAITGALTANTGTFGNLTSGRVPVITTAGLLTDSADLTFATDTLTATKVITPASITTPKVYAYGTTPSPLALGGSGVVGCGSPPSPANCEAPTYNFDSAFFEQRLKTDTAYRTQWFINDDGGHLRAYNASGWLPLKIDGGPTEIGGGGLHVGSVVVSDPGLGNATLDGYVGSPTFASQTTGWRIDGLGAADFRYLYTDELHARKFVVDLEQALAGLQIIAKSVGQLGAEFTVPAGGSVSTLTMKDLPSAPGMAVFESGDYVWLRQFSRASGTLSITDGYGTVTGYTDQADGLQTWTFTRLVSNGGAMATGAVLAIDTIVLDMGVSGNGFVETNAVDGVYGINSPYTQIVTWSGNSPIAANRTVRSRIGNLRGITSTTGEYGAILGTYAATNGQYIKASTEGVELHGVDLKLWNGTTNVIRLDHTTPYWSMGSPAPTTYSSGNGCWSGLDGGTFKWRCGNPAGTNLIAWDGSVLTVVGAITITGNVPDANNALALVGTAGATVVSGAALGTLGLTATGNPKLPAVATPSGSGLFLGSDYMGYYTAGAWKTYMTSAGNFYLGGTSGALQWNGTTLTISGNVGGTITGNGSGITSIAGGNITTDTVTATQIAADAITASELAADSVTSAKIVAGTIVASDIAAGTITAAHLAANTITTGQINFTPVLSGGAAGDINGNLTQIDGWQIKTGTIALAQLNFVPILHNNVIASINASAEGGGTLKIAANKIEITGPTGFLAAGQAASDVNAYGTLINGGKITTDSITVNHLTVNSVNGTKVTDGSLTGDDIQANSITANKLSVGSLSAISGDIGTITAGSITGVSASFGGSGGSVGLNSNGVTITSGSGVINKVKWDNGSYIVGDGTYTVIAAPNQVKLYASTDAYMLDGGGFYPESSGKDLGYTSGRWDDLWLSGTAHINALTSGPVCADGGTLLMCGPPNLDAVVERLLADPRLLDALTRALARLEGNR